MDGFNDVKKRYLATCLIMRITSKVDNFDSKSMRIDVITDKGEVSFSEECKRLLNVRDEIGTRGDKQHVKCEYKARLKHKYYWVHKKKT